MNTTGTARLLAVDLDGTLHDGDLAMQLAKRRLVSKPWRAPQLLAWLAHSRLHFKNQLAQNVDFDPAKLAWHSEVLTFLRAHRDRKLVLATAAMHSQAELIATYLAAAQQISFSHVLASTAKLNLIGFAKATALAQLAGAAGFDYLGDSPLQDPPVFAQATVCHFVNPTAELLNTYRSENSVVFTTSPRLLGRLRRVMLNKVQQDPHKRR